MAAEANRRALKLNPFLWQSFADLCNRGQRPDAKQIFQFTSSDTFATCQGHNLNAVVAFAQSMPPSQHHQQPPSSCADASDVSSAASIHQTPVSSAGQMFSGDMQTPLNYASASYGSHHGLITPQNPQPMSGVEAMRHMDETPVSNGTGSMMDTADCGGGPGSQTPFRKQFKYLSSVSPSTPSFGFLSMSSPADSAGLSTATQQTATTGAGIASAAVAASAVPASVGKKLRGQVAGGLITRKDTPLQLSKPIFSQSGGNITPRTPINSSSAANPNAANQATLTGQNVRRSSRLSFSNCNSAVKENNKSSAAAAINKFAAPRSPPRKTKQRITKMNLANTALNELNNEKLKSEKSAGSIEAMAAATAASTTTTTTMAGDADATQQQAAGLGQRLGQQQPLNATQQMLQLKRHSAEGLMVLLRDLGEGYAQLQQYNCADAIEAFGAVQPHHFNSSWVQSMVAKAHYELHQYEAAAKIFHGVHRREPHRLHLMEIYSTVLWHLHREVALSALAQDLVAQDKSSPVTWCVSGNCFSLHKEHETAIKFFERAVQVSG